METTCHILQAWHVTDDTRIVRHNNVVSKLVGHCKKQGWEVFEEPHIRHQDRTLYKTDIVTFTAPTSGVISDVQISWETNELMAEL